jgi:hypothetical protein
VAELVIRGRRSEGPGGGVAVSSGAREAEPARIGTSALRRRLIELAGLEAGSRRSHRRQGFCLGTEVLAEDQTLRPIPAPSAQWSLHFHDPQPVPRKAPSEPRENGDEVKQKKSRKGLDSLAADLDEIGAPGAVDNSDAIRIHRGNCVLLRADRERHLRAASTASNELPHHTHPDDADWHGKEHRGDQRAGTVPVAIHDDNDGARQADGDR